MKTKCSRYPYEYLYKDSNGRPRKIVRQEVPAGVISWDIPYEAYDPITFNLNLTPNTDPDIKDPTFNPQFNQIDGPIDRRSFEGPYRVYQKVPLNIRGRTGLFGRGILPRYGPNHTTGKKNQQRIEPHFLRPNLSHFRFNCD